jgi:hypothetical protein
MANAVLDSDVLKITLSEQGHIWFLEGNGMPHQSGVDATTFLESAVFRAAAHVRMVGNAANAKLILQLYGHKLDNRIRSLEVCSPLCCDSPDDRKDPEVMLYQMRNFWLPGSLGGWHEFSHHDLFSYMLAAHFHEHDNITVEQRKVMTVHRLWPCLSFIDGIDLDSCARLVGALVDPRWYIDADDPDRNSKLEQFLGLNPKTQCESEKGGDKQSYYKLVLKCWKTGSPPGQLSLNARHFLWRAWHSKGGGPKGDLIASKFFVAYLRATWTSLVCNRAHAGRLFVPEYFFLRSEEARAFREHYKKATE